MKRKTMKKTGAAVLTMAMLLSMGALSMSVNAAAGDAKTIQIKNPSSATVTGARIYKVASQNSTTGNWEWEGVFTNNQSFETLENASAETLNNLANSFKAQAARATAVTANEVQGFANGVQYELDITGRGYYLVIPTISDNSVAVQPSLIEIDSTGDAYTVVNTKANPLPLNKYITATTDGETASGNKSKTSTGILGSTVSYSIESVLPEYDVNVDSSKIKSYVLTDDPSDGINIDVETVVVNVNGADVTDDSNVTVAEAGDGFTVTVAGSFVKKYEGKNIVVTFDAEIDSDAVYGDALVSDAAIHNGSDNTVRTGNPNTVTLTWGNNYATGAYAYPEDHEPTPDEPEVPEEPQVTLKDTVTTYIGKVELNKQGEQNGDMVSLPNAKFTLSGTNYDEQTFTTDGNGYIDFGYLPAGTYTLTETQAPRGYKTIGQTYTFTVVTKDPTSNSADFSTYEVEAEGVDGVVEVELTENNAVAAITVTDPPADTLPATGSIGTYVFTFGGAAIVLLAGVLFVVYMKKRKAED